MKNPEYKITAKLADDILEVLQGASTDETVEYNNDENTKVLEDFQAAISQQDGAVKKPVRPPIFRQQYPDFSITYEIKEDEERLVISPNIAGNAFVELLQAIETIKTKMATPNADLSHTRRPKL